jgi:hypothetical protein
MFLFIILYYNTTCHFLLMVNPSGKAKALKNTFLKVHFGLMSLI